MMRCERALYYAWYIIYCSDASVCSEEFVFCGCAIFSHSSQSNFHHPPPTVTFLVFDHHCTVGGAARAKDRDVLFVLRGRRRLPERDDPGESVRSVSVLLCAIHAVKSIHGSRSARWFLTSSSSTHAALTVTT
jgi:hypothetical protein